MGNVYACQTTFRNGARHDGPWFHGDTWNPAEKPRVSGSIMWPDADHTVTVSDEQLTVQSSGLPINQPTGRFPIVRSDSVYQYDTNPNRMAAQDLAFAIPVRPTKAATPSCLPMGMIGFTNTGVALYNALVAAGRDAAAHEIQDLCDGHPQGNSQFHYHNGSSCIPGMDSDAQVGWPLDGYPILGLRDASGTLLTNADLDACHGRAETVTMDDYAYHLTREYPYILGCFTGQVLSDTQRNIRQGLLPLRAGAPRRRAPER